MCFLVHSDDVFIDKFVNGGQDWLEDGQNLIAAIRIVGYRHFRQENLFFRWNLTVISNIGKR
jgi:hypothetical protein